MNSKSQASKSQALERVVKGIQSKRISDADFLSLAIESSAKKKAKIDILNEKENQGENLNKNFDRDICLSAKKEDKFFKPYRSSPYQVLGDLYQSNQDLSNSDKEKRNRPSDFIIEAVNDAIEFSLDEIKTITRESIEPLTSNSSFEENFNNLSHDSSQFENSVEKRFFLSKDTISKSMANYLLNILNNGTYEQLISLACIGNIRAMKIFTWRNAGNKFESFEDLYEINMNEKIIQRFIRSNLGTLLTDSYSNN